MKLDLRNRRTLLIFLSVAFVVLFTGGIAAAILSRHDTICPDRKPPIAQRGGLLGPPEFLCHGGVGVAK